MAGGHAAVRPDNAYRRRCGRKAEVRGWDAESLAEFDRRWKAGEVRKVIAHAFNISDNWVDVIRARRGLAKRLFRGGRPGPRHSTRCAKCRRDKKACRGLEGCTK
jgi:hypothetical protein